MTPKIKTVIKKRQKAYCKGDMQMYQHLKTEVSNLVVNAKSKYYNNKASGLQKHDPSRWYREVNKLIGISSPSSQTLKTSDKDLKNLAEYFQKSFTSLWNNQTSTANQEVPTSLRDISPPIPSIGLVKHYLKHLNPKKATGCDGIPAWLLKTYHEELAVVVHDIISTSIKQQTYPALYKHAYVIPVPKVPRPSCVDTDYRQISILPQIAKVLERVQLKLNSKHLHIRSNQHAFTENRSTVTALTDVTQTWFNATDNTTEGRKGIHALFLDFSKAFDRVDHGTLLAKLASTSVCQAFWKWTRSFLSNRTQQVRLPGAVSTISSCPTGVPQGSVISPSLFCVLVNDMEDAIPTENKCMQICR